MTEQLKAEDQKVEIIPEELADGKVYTQMSNLFGDEETREFYRRSENELKATLAASAVQKAEAIALRDANEAYQKAKAIISDFNKSTNEVIKPLDLKTKGAAAILNYRSELKKIK